jgi:hypothetical protein
MARPVKKMSFASWIKKEGAVSLASRLGVTKSVVYMWATYASLPRRKHMIAMKKMSKGAITYDSIIEG